MSDPIDSLLSLFLDLHLEGVKPGEWWYYTDYVLVEYHLAWLNLTPEIIADQKRILNAVKGNPETREKFRKHIIDVQDKLRKYGWGYFDKQLNKRKKI